MDAFQIITIAFKVVEIALQVFAMIVNLDGNFKNNKIRVSLIVEMK
mgnify:CR=1 FL=1